MLKHYLFIALLLITGIVCPQVSTTILTMPMGMNTISFDPRTTKMLRHNNVKSELMRNAIADLSVKRISNGFIGYSPYSIRETEYHYLIDSLKIEPEWDFYQINELRKQYRNISPVIPDINQPRFRYFSRVLNDKAKLIFQALMKKNNCRYLLLLNGFEAITPMPFVRKTYFCLHIEVYDINLTKLFGGKSYRARRISRKMYSNVFNYFALTAIDDLYKRVNIFLYSKNN